MTSRLRPRVWRRFKLGGELWRVKLVSPKSRHLRDGDGEAMGVCDYEACTIYLAWSLEHSVLVSTFLHEALHAILYVSQADEAYGKDPKTDERIVGTMTPVLHQFLHQTAELFTEAR